MEELNFQVLTETVLRQMHEMGYSVRSINSYKLAYRGLRLFIEHEYNGAYSAEVGYAFIKKAEHELAGTHRSILTSYKISVHKLNDVLNNQPIRNNHRVETGFIHSCYDAYIEQYKKYLSQYFKKAYSVDKHTRIVAEFLYNLEQSGVNRLDNLTPKQIYAQFVLSSNKHDFAVVLRKFLKSARKQRWLPLDYSGMVPSCKRHHPTPTVYSKEEVEKLLRSVDRTSISGKRTYAVLLLIARLGLRISDVCNLEFGNLSFNTKSIHLVQVKTGQSLDLPLLPDVDEAINDYIKNARPVSDSPKVFLKVYAPFNTMTPPAMKYQLRLLFLQAGINTSNKHQGTHSLRSSLASALLSEGISYPIIQKILGHSQPRATKYYTKFDIKQLQSCALAVPLPSGSFIKHLGG